MGRQTTGGIHVREGRRHRRQPAPPSDLDRRQEGHRRVRQAGLREAQGLILVALASGCGRIDFAATAADADLRHDEDGDGLADAIDPCPQLAGDAADRDGDGVGDACDPLPDTPTEHWLWFATLQPGDQPFVDASGLGQAADALDVVGDHQLQLAGTFARVRIDVGFDIRGLVGTGQHQFAIGVASPSPAAEYYFGELNDDGGFRDVAIVRYDGTNGYVNFDPQTYAGIHAGSARFLLDAGPQHTLVAGWPPGELYTSTSATADYAGGDTLHFSINGLDVAIRYIALIATE